MKIITSLQNPVVKNIVSLHDSRTQKKEKLCVAEGLRVVETFLQHKMKLEQLFIVEDVLAQAETLVTDDEITLVSPEVMKKISSASTPSGILGLFKIPEPVEPEKLQKSIVLAQLQDPGNMGTTMRTAAALGLSAVIVIEGVYPWHQKVIQASAGTIACLPVFEWSWEEFMQKSNHQQRAALVVKNGVSPKNIPTESILIVGNEAHGLPAQWLAECGQLVTLPMPGGTESLNASVAASIALYAIYGNL